MILYERAFFDGVSPTLEALMQINARVRALGFDNREHEVHRATRKCHKNVNARGFRVRGGCLLRFQRGCHERFGCDGQHRSNGEA